MYAYKINHVAIFHFYQRQCDAHIRMCIRTYIRMYVYKLNITPCMVMYISLLPKSLYYAYTHIHL